MAKLDVPATRLHAPKCRHIPNGDRRLRSGNAYSSSVRRAEEDFVMAEQTILHDAGHPSRITLAVIP